MFNGILEFFKKGKSTSDPGVLDKLSHLEEILGIEIEDEQLYIKALRHRSILDTESGSESDESYERLEFLGDAVLDLIVSEIIFEYYPEENEGFMTKLRAQIVKGDSLAEYAAELDLGTVLEVGDRARGQGIEYSKSILADVFESIIGALYLTKGYDRTFAFVQKVTREMVDFDELTEKLDNYKSMLLEYTQARQQPIPEYNVVNEYGPGHDKTFKIEVLIGRKSMGEGIGKSKKEAEQEAAKNALDYLYKKDDEAMR